ncbi:MAG: mediator of RNA polymerase II transcription subunit 13 [Phylliscum demangeonii]|nr:MAG: mediator of RNA polymerase II transcription subunit 13 [Phylliscum demangeonii]
MFNEIGVTEADFSFFDNPESDGEAMHGVIMEDGLDLPPATSNDVGIKDNVEPAIAPRPSQEERLKPSSAVRERASPDVDAAQVWNDFSGHVDGPSTSPAHGPATPLRAAQTETLASTGSNIDPSHGLAYQIMSPPLSPDLLMRKLLPDEGREAGAQATDQISAPLSDHQTQAPARKRSRQKQKPNSFDPVRFNRAVDLTKEKYHPDGRFWFAASQHAAKTETGAGLKRKRLEESDNSMISSLEHLTFGLNNGSGSASLGSDMALDCLDGGPNDWSLAGFFDAEEFEKRQIFELNDEDFIKTAQIVADQAVSRLSIRQLWSWTKDDLAAEAPLEEMARFPTRGLLQKIVQRVFPDAAELDLDAYAAAEEVLPDSPSYEPQPSATSRPRVRQPKGNRGKKTYPPAAVDAGVFPIPLPPVLVRRGDTHLHILPTALPHWEPLGLSPCGGTKDVTAFCVYPTRRGMEELVHEFLETVGRVYEGCQLGQHGPGEFFAYRGGCVPVEIGELEGAESNLGPTMEAIKDTCKLLGDLLPNLNATSHNVVVYLVNPFSHQDAIVDLCAAFLALFDAYTQSPTVQHARDVHEIVLQIVPLGLVVSEMPGAVPAHGHYSNLAMGVYDRCALRYADDDPTSLGQPSPAVLLAHPLVDRIGFKLSAEPPPSLLHEKCSLHVAYSCSVDDRWISVAWSDSHGDRPMHMSYCLLREESAGPARPFADVAQEVWAISTEMIQSQRLSSSLILAKVGVMAVDEMEVWITLASRADPSPISVSLVSIDRRPALSLHLPPQWSLAEVGVADTAMYTTPLSTSPPKVNSPDPIGHTAAFPGTPTDGGADTEIHSTLVSTADEVWGAILSHRGQHSHSAVDHQPALASGLLVGRGGVLDDDDDRPVCVAVHLLHTSQPAAEPLLREILTMYRGLNVLARWRHGPDLTTTTRSSRVLPWHVAAAVTAQEALSLLM